MKGGGLNPGDRPPDFELPDLAGTKHKLSDYAGKVVLLNFWASWCGPCVAELPALEHLYNAYKDKNFVVLGVGVDDNPEALDEFRKKYSLTFPILVDRTGSLKGRYRVTGVPESFVIDKEGKLSLIADPDSGQPAVRIIGPREWDSPTSLSSVSQLLSSQ